MDVTTRDRDPTPDPDRTPDSSNRSTPAEGGVTHETNDSYRDVHHRLTRVERFLERRNAVQTVEAHAGAAWRRVTREEPRVPVTIAILVAIALMVALPARVANHPRWLLPGLAVLLLIGVFVAKSTQDRRSRALRATSLLLIGVLSIANAASAARLVLDLVNSRGITDPAVLLLTGAAIWLTNVVVFALWYWEFDRGGPVARALASKPYPDFLFPQMTSPEMTSPDWEPTFVDYLYVSFTNATAFSPTDVMPLSRWAKLTMLAQSLVSIVTVALVVARAVNVLK
jgi:uncharacterized membrane protein